MEMMDFKEGDDNDASGIESSAQTWVLPPPLPFSASAFASSINCTYETESIVTFLALCSLQG